MEQVLKLDKDCEEAVNDLYNCKVLQLMVNTHIFEYTRTCSSLHTHVAMCYQRAHDTYGKWQCIAVTDLLNCFLVSFLL